MTIQVVILAAGMGTRLARPHPKPLTKLVDGRTIMQQQVDNLRSAFGNDLRLTIVVGYKMEQIMEHMPDASFVYNENYDQTNTSKSLLKALKNSTSGGVLWLNGDVVFDPAILETVKPLIIRDIAFVTVNSSEVSDEEVKYTVNTLGTIGALSKSVPQHDALGEAVGINFVSKSYKDQLITQLERVGEQDFFEKAIESSIINCAQSWVPSDLGTGYAVEIDFPEDLERANKKLGHAISRKTQGS